MIEIKINDEVDNKISVETKVNLNCSRGYAKECFISIFETLDEVDHKLFSDALNRFMIDKIMDKLDEIEDDESEDEE